MINTAILQIGPLFGAIASAVLLILVKGVWRRMSKDVIAIISVAGLLALVWGLWSGWLNGVPFLKVSKLSFIGGIIMSLAAIMAIIGAVGISKEGRSGFFGHSILVLFGSFGAVIMLTASNLLAIVVGIETLSFCSYLLAGLERNSNNASEASIKYFTTGAFASAIFLMGVALFFGATGSFDIGVLGLGGADIFLLKFSAVFLLIGLLFKSAITPFHFWAPDVYEGAPTSSVLFFATVVKVAAIVLALRLFSAIWKDVSLEGLVAVLAVLTVFVGNLGAIFQENFKRLIAYSSIANAGYILLSFVMIGGFQELCGSIVLFYLLAYIFPTIGLLMISTFLKGGSVNGFAVLYKRHPLYFFSAGVFLLSLIGVPPTAGFLGKFYLFRGLVTTGHLYLAIAGILGSLISVYYYVRPLIMAYYYNDKVGDDREEFSYSTLGIILFCLIATILLGLFPSVVMDVLAVSPLAS